MADQKPNRAAHFENGAAQAPAPQGQPAPTIEFELLMTVGMVSLFLNKDDADDRVYFSLFGGYKYVVSGIADDIDTADLEQILAGAHEKYEINVGAGVYKSGNKLGEAYLYANISVKKEARSGAASRFRK